MDQGNTDSARNQYRFWCEEKLRNADTDQNGHVNNAVVATLFEAGRIELLAAPQTAHIRKATSIVVAKQLVNFKKELFFPGSVRVGARVSRVGRSTPDFECTLLADNVEVATAETTCVLLDRATRKPPPISEEFRTYLTGT